MADMTQKHHNLIVDAIVDGLKVNASDPRIERLYKQIMDGTISKEQFIQMLSEATGRNLADTFSKKLYYTHDKFEGSKFRAHVESGVNRGRF